MGRECRRVPHDWVHPQDLGGYYIPQAVETPNTESSRGFMPQWPEKERTHYQLYETRTAGTPLSPVFATPEELAQYCTNQGMSIFARKKGSYDIWLRVANGAHVDVVVTLEDDDLIEIL